MSSATHRFEMALILIMVLLLAGVMIQQQSPSTPDPAPRVYWGAFNIAVPWDPAALIEFEQQVGKHQSIIHWGHPWVDQDRFQPFPTALAQDVRERGAIPMINWGSWELGEGRDQPDFRLSEISSGRYDDYIREWASDARDWGHPFFLRFNHEMNGWWLFPWAEQANGNQPGDFVTAWRHVHDIFTEEGASNVTWVWAPNIDGPDTTPLPAVYPGDAYVDWLAMDGYNATGNLHWESFTQVFRPTYEILLSLAPDKPIMLAEWGSREEGGDKGDWIEDALLVQIPFQFPQIKAVVWFNWHDQPDQTYEIHSSPESLEAFRRSIQADFYAANTFDELDESPIPPLDP